jgi:hypothetical protein
VLEQYKFQMASIEQIQTAILLNYREKNMSDIIDPYFSANHRIP